MFGFAATKLDEFEKGKISRRQLIQTLTAATTATGAASSASAQAGDPPTKGSIVNHISYTCPNFKQAADWYSRVFNLEQVVPKETEVQLTFGKMGERPYGVSDVDVPLSFLIMRTRPTAAPPPGQQTRPAPTAVVDHIAYTIADYDRDRVLAELKNLGFAYPREDGEHSFHIVDPFGYDVQISGINMTALTSG
jgi:catechol 2,3-dioxygenase-like lactoylglutathione lyase family enzyme